MGPSNATDALAEAQKQYAGKFVAEDQIFRHIHRGHHIFIGSGCGEPQYLLQALIRYVQAHPKAFLDTELLQVWTLGLAPYTDEKLKDNFRYNSFFVGPNTREAINTGLADYSPIFLSKVPDLLLRRVIPVDVALVQASPPDAHGYMSLGVSVDTVKAAVEAASLVIVQVNREMPRVHGDGFIHIDEVDFVIPHDEPLLEYRDDPESEITERIGAHVSRLIQDGDTIQVGYGSIPNGITRNLKEKRHLGVHTELLSDGIVELIRLGVVDNSRKGINRGKTVASFCMGTRDTYAFIHDNPTIEFRTIDYTNNPLVIAQHEHMVAINSSLEIDLTGQATAESLGSVFYSGIGGQADFMRGAVLARHGKTILALQSTAKNGTVSRIVPFLRRGAGVTLNRGDIHYVVTEYGIAYLHGKNIRERAMELVAIAHPKFREELIREARECNLIYRDQAFIPGEKGEYPEALETHRTTKTGLEIQLRPVKIKDEPLLKDFFYSLSDRTMERRFFSMRKDVPHDVLQKFVVIDYTREIIILAAVKEGEKGIIAGMGQYIINEADRTAEIAVLVRDAYQGHGIGFELVSYLTQLARKKGLLGFTGEVLFENKPMLRVFEKMGYRMEKKVVEDVYELKMWFQ